MNLFETVKSAVTVKQAARCYGLKASRNDMVCCPFHEDRHPSMKLNEDYYFCFGCGAAGDVIDLTAKLFDLTKYEAARKLKRDFGIGPDDPPSECALARERRRVIRAFREEEMYCHRVICDYLHLLEGWEKDYAPQVPGLPADDRFVEACQMKNYAEYLADVLTFGETQQRIEMVKALLKDGTVRDLEERMKRFAEQNAERKAA